MSHTILSPSTTLCNSEDIYHKAISQLSQKVPDVISADELESFLDACAPDDCTTFSHANDILQRVQTEEKYRGKFHGFFKLLHGLFEPLRLFKSALDTICQVHSTFCLVWGSMKALIEIAKEVAQVPTVIEQAIENLLDFFPVYEQYHKCLHFRTNDGFTLEKPLIAIYVEYLAFCIIARKVAKAKIRNTVRHIMQETSPFKTCLQIVQTQAQLIHQITSALTLIEAQETSNKVDILIDWLVNSRMSVENNASSATSAPYHIVPGILSPGFVGRAAELEWLETTLNPEDDKLTGMRVGIHGITGVGKTQLMLKYEAKFRECYSTQIFLNASSLPKFIDSIQDISETMCLPQRHSKSSNAKIQGLHNWLCQSSNWLLLIDNAVYELVDPIRELLATDIQGHVIITSQFKGAVETIIGSSKACRSLPELDLDNALLMFISAANLDYTTENNEYEIEVVRAMGLVPGAVERAASYIRVNHISPEAFLSRYTRTPEHVLEWDDFGPANSTYRVAISKHFQMIFETLEETNKDALIVLQFYSLLEPEAIPLLDEWTRSTLESGFKQYMDLLPDQTKKRSQPFCSLFSCFVRDNNESSLDAISLGVGGDKTVHGSDSLSDIFKDRFRREGAIAKLSDLHLITRVEGTRLVRMHDLTKRVIRSRISPADLERWLYSGICVIYHMMPVNDESPAEQTWVASCLSQANNLVHMAKSLDLEVGRYASLLALCAMYNLRHGSWSLSRQQLNNARPVYETFLGESHPRTLALVESLAWADRHTGQMTVAEAKFRQVWQRREATSGPHAPDTLRTLDALASTIERAGKLKEAEIIFSKLYNLHKETSGMAGEGTLVAAHNFAVCLYNQGRLTEAIQMFKATLKDSEEHFGLENQGTLKTLSNYAAALDHDGRYDEAQAAYGKALPQFIRVMGIDHHLTLRLRGNMAGLCRQKGDLDRAETIMRSCLDTLSQVFGADSFETFSHLYEMAEIWQCKGDLKKAKDTLHSIMSQLSVDMRDHPVVFRFIDSWGAVEKEMGHLDIAEHKSNEALNKFQSLLGWHDPYTLMAANDHGEVLYAQGRYQEAWDIFTRCRESLMALVGKEHPHCAMVVNNLGRLCWVLNKDPMPFFQEAFESLAARVGAGHFCSLVVSLNIARTKFASGQFEQATMLVNETKMALEEILGNHHPTVSACNIILGIMFSSRGNTASLTTAREHFLNAVQNDQQAGHVYSSNFFLSVAFVIIVSRRLQDDESMIEQFLPLLESPAAEGLSPFNIPHIGKISLHSFSHMGAENFDFNVYIPLIIGESIKLRWGRKTCWREVSGSESVLVA